MSSEREPVPPERKSALLKCELVPPERKSAPQCAFVFSEHKSISNKSEFTQLFQQTSRPPREELSINVVFQLAQCLGMINVNPPPQRG